MAFSLSNWFKGKPPTEQDEASSSHGAAAREAAPSPAPATPSPAPAAPSAVRTVMPKSVQPVSLRDLASASPSP